MSTGHPRPTFGEGLRPRRNARPKVSISAFVPANENIRRPAVVPRVGQETTAFNISVFRVPAQRVAICGTRTRGFDYVPAVNARGVFCWWL